ncbi:MAG TPA: tetratricopeptide repeat protein [Acidisphaera sp.]|nr:tetratricopeptide repeat protein [Acidisphaera sp.]HME20044.1 tetratricopeptide repeat protein [Acetobacteraceae bacterium]
MTASPLHAVGRAQPFAVQPGTPSEEALLRQVLDADPADLAALLALAELRQGRGDAAGAVTLLLRAAALVPDDAQVWQALGGALVRAGEIAAVRPVLRRALDCAPSRLYLAQQWAEVAARSGAAPAADAELAARIAADPLDAVALHATATLRWQEGRTADALDLIDVVLALRPDDPAPAILRAVLLTRTLQLTEAEAAMAHAVALAPDDLQLANDHAVLLNRLCRYEEARAALEAHIARFGPTSRAMCNLANALLLMGDQQAAEAVGLRAMSVWPDDFPVRRALCAAMAYTPCVTGTSLSDQLRAASPLAPRVLPPASWTADRDPDRRLRIGLLSGTLRVHPVGWLTVAGFEALDRDAFELVVFAHHTADDFIARRFRAIAAEWHDVQPLTNPALAELARQRGIDILIDLGGYGEHGRMPACAERLAPVQVKWVGSQYHTTGLAEMDWMLTDRWETPDGFERFYSERLLRLPDGYVCYAPSPDTPDVAKLPARAAGAVTFGCFNNIAKVTPQVLAAWAEILRRALRPRGHRSRPADGAGPLAAPRVPAGLQRGRPRARPVPVFRRADDVRGAVHGRARADLARRDLRQPPLAQPRLQCRAAGLGRVGRRRLHRARGRLGGRPRRPGSVARRPARQDAPQSALRRAALRPQPRRSAALRMAGLVPRRWGEGPGDRRLRSPPGGGSRAVRRRQRGPACVSGFGPSPSSSQRR